MTVLCSRVGYTVLPRFSALPALHSIAAGVKRREYMTERGSIHESIKSTSVRAILRQFALPRSVYG